MFYIFSKNLTLLSNRSHLECSITFVICDKKNLTDKLTQRLSCISLTANVKRKVAFKAYFEAIGL